MSVEELKNRFKKFAIQVAKLIPALVKGGNELLAITVKSIKTSITNNAC